MNKLLFVTSQENVSYGSSYNLTSINASSGTVERSIQLPSPAGTIAVDAEDGSVYVGSPGNSIYAINGSTGMVTSNIPAGCPQGCFPEVQTYDSANEEVFVTDLGNNNLTVVRNSTFLSSFYVGSAPNGAAYDSANHDIYVANEGSYDLTVVNGSSDTPAEEVAPVVTGPGVAYDPRAGSILVCSNNASNPLNPNFVTAVNGSSNRIVARIPVIASCGGVAFDPSNGYVYVTNEILDLNLSWGSSVTVIDPESNEVVAGLPAGLNPIGIAYDPENEGVYVANCYSGTVGELPSLTRVTFDESGLPSASNWSVTMGGRAYYSHSDNLTFPELSGTFGYSVTPVEGFSAEPSIGNLTLFGSAITVNVTFVNSTSPNLVRQLSPLLPLDLVTVTGGVGAGIIAAVVAVTRRRGDTGREELSAPPATRTARLTRLLPKAWG